MSLSFYFRIFLASLSIIRDYRFLLFLSFHVLLFSSTEFSRKRRCMIVLSKARAFPSIPAILLDDLNLLKLKLHSWLHQSFQVCFLHNHIRRGFIIIESAHDKNRSVFTQGTRPLKDPTKFERKKNNPRSLNVSQFSVFSPSAK